MTPFSFAVLWLGLVSGQPKVEVINLACQSGQGLIIDNHGGTVSGANVDGDTTVGCLIYSDNDKVTDISINGYHYDKCGPTKNGITPCMERGPIWETFEPAGYFLLQPLPKPVSHVIEIRTKRVAAKEQPVCDDDEHYCHCPTTERHEHCNKWELYWESNQPVTPKKCIEKHIWCEGKTVKTLWIDNQRIGVIKEVEEK